MTWFLAGRTIKPSLLATPFSTPHESGVFFCRPQTFAGRTERINASQDHETEIAAVSVVYVAGLAVCAFVTCSITSHSTLSLRRLAEKLTVAPTASLEAPISDASATPCNRDIGKLSARPETRPSSVWLEFALRRAHTGQKRVYTLSMSFVGTQLLSPDQVCPSPPRNSPRKTKRTDCPVRKV